MKNVLLFRYKPDFSDEIVLVADNHLDLQEYLEKELDWEVIEIDTKEQRCYFKERDWSEVEQAECRYIKKI